MKRSPPSRRQAAALRSILLGVLLTVGLGGLFVLALRNFRAETSSEEPPPIVGLAGQPPTAPTLLSRPRRPLVAPSGSEPSASPWTGSGVLLRVADTRDAPISGAHVALFSPQLGLEESHAALCETDTDARGEAHCELPRNAGARVFDCAVTAKDYASASLRGVRFSEQTELTVRLAAAAAIEGRVVTSDMKPLAGAQVIALGPGVPYRMPGSLRAGFARQVDFADDGTRTDGGFRLGGLREGRPYALSVICSGFALTPEDAKSLEAVVPGQQAPVVIIMHPAYRLTYSIIDAETRRPPADPRLWPSSMSIRGPDGSALAVGLRPDGFGARSAFSDDLLWLADDATESLGPIHISLGWPGYVETEHTVHARRWRLGEPVQGQVIEVHRSQSWREPGALVLEFTQPDGTPVRSVASVIHFCHLRSLDGGSNLDFRFEPNNEGKMRFEGVPPGEYALVTNLGPIDARITSSPVRVESGQERILLARCPSIGMIQLNAPNEAVPTFVELTINSVPPNRHPYVRFGVPFPEGRALVPYLPEGAYAVRVQGGYLVDEPQQVEVRSGGVSTIDLALKAR